MPFKPGVSGNPEGRANEFKFKNALNRAIAQDDSVRLRAAVEKLLDLAAGGEQWAAMMLADRLDGRPAQTNILAGDADNPIVISEVTRKIIE